MRNPPRSCDLHGGFFAPCGLPKPLPLGEVSPEATERASPARKRRRRSDRQAFYQSDTIAVPVILGQQPSPLSLVALLLASSPKGGAIGMSVRLRLSTTSQSASQTAPLVGEPLAKRRSFPLCQSLPSVGATATTAASGGNREELLGPRPAGCERQRSRRWEPQPGQWHCEAMTERLSSSPSGRAVPPAACLRGLP